MRMIIFFLVIDKVTRQWSENGWVKTAASVGGWCHTASDRLRLQMNRQGNPGFKRKCNGKGMQTTRHNQPRRLGPIKMFGILCIYFAQIGIIHITPDWRPVLVFSDQNGIIHPTPDTGPVPMSKTPLKKKITEKTYKHEMFNWCVCGEISGLFFFSFSWGYQSLNLYTQTTTGRQPTKGSHVATSQVHGLALRWDSWWRCRGPGCCPTSVAKMRVRHGSRRDPIPLTAGTCVTGMVPGRSHTGWLRWHRLTGPSRNEWYQGHNRTGTRKYPPPKIFKGFKDFQFSPPRVLEMYIRKHSDTFSSVLWALSYAFGERGIVERM